MTGTPRAANRRATVRFSGADVARQPNELEARAPPPQMLPYTGLTRVPDVEEALFIAEARALGGSARRGRAGDRDRGALERRQVDAAQPAGGAQGAGAHLEDAGADARAW